MFNLNFHESEYNTNESEDDDSDYDESETVEADDEIEEDCNSIESPVFDIVMVGNIIALYTPSNVSEQYYLCKVIEKCIIDNSMSHEWTLCIKR